MTATASPVLNDGAHPRQLRVQVFISGVDLGTKKYRYFRTEAKARAFMDDVLANGYNPYNLSSTHRNHRPHRVELTERFCWAGYTYYSHRDAKGA